MSNLAICTVNNQSVLPNPTTGAAGLNVSAGSTITIGLAVSGSSWSINATMTDMTNVHSTAALVNATKSQNFTNNTCTFIMPAMSGFLGASVQFQSIINNDPTTTFTFGVFVPNIDGYRLVFNGETTESNAISGVAPDLNHILGAGGTLAAMSGDVTGLAGNNVVHAISGSSPLVMTPGTVEWGSGVATPTLTQASTTGAPNNMTISAQSTTSGANAGANLYLNSGHGIFPGEIHLQLDGTDFIGITVSGITFGGSLLSPKLASQVVYTGSITLNQRTTTANTTIVKGSDYQVVIGAITTTITITLPASPSAGDVYLVTDGTGIVATHNVTVAGNGHNINGASTDLLNTNFQSHAYIFNGTQWNLGSK